MKMNALLKSLRLPKSWRLLLLLPLLAVSFQNCGQSFQVDNPSLIVDDGPKEQSNNDYFGYPYSAKPEFMGEIDLITAHKLDAATYDTSAQGVVINADSPGTAVTFEVHLLNSSNQDVCPPYNDTTTGTTQTMISTCIANAWGSLLKVRLMAYSATQGKMVLVREKLYRGL